MNLYKTIGRIISNIQSADDYDTAMKAGIECIIEANMADYAVLWYRSNNQKSLIPFYWICPVDLNTCKCTDGVFFDSVIDQKDICINDFDEENNPEIRDMFAGIDIDSIHCVPFEDGSLVFIKEKGHGNFSEDEIETNNILVMTVEMGAKEKTDISIDYENRERILSIRDLRKSFVNGQTETKVLNGINFNLFKGEFLCVLGESGCGKSTLLNIIGGLIRADSGSIRFMDTELLGMSEDELTEYRRKYIGFVFQAYNLMPHLTAGENLELIAENSDDFMDTNEALRLVAMEDKIDNFPSELSGGQQQRVSIARAIVKKPMILFADEPTAALDYDTSIEVLEVFDRIVKSGTTLIMVTHNKEITRMADRVINIRRGKIYETTVNKHPVSARELVW